MPRVLVALAYASSTTAAAMDLDQKPIKASLVRQGKPREEKLLPRKEQPPPPPKEQKAPAAGTGPRPAEAVAPAPVAAPRCPSTKRPGEGGRRRKQLFARSTR